MIHNLFRLQNHRTDREGMKQLQRLEDAFENVTSGYRFEIDLSGNALALYFRLGAGELIHASECGLGLQDVLIMLYACVIDDSDCLLIEEPENHLHPSMQRELLRFFSTVDQKAFFLSTHSSVVLDQRYVKTAIRCRYEEYKIKVKEETSKYEALSDLGYSSVDNITSEVILLIEGPHDKEAVEEIVHLLPGPMDTKVKIWFLGGDIMDKHDLSILNEHFTVEVLVDREGDKSSRRIRQSVAEKCLELGISCTVLEKYAFENYYSIEAYKSVFGDERITASEIKPDEKVQKQIGVDPKGRTRELVQATGLAGFQGTDLYETLVRIYSK